MVKIIWHDQALQLLHEYIEYALAEIESDKEVITTSRAKSELAGRLVGVGGARGRRWYFIRYSFWVDNINR